MHPSVILTLMLSREEQDYIREKGWLWDHCWRYFSLLAGEPFLIDDCLVHYDGHHLYCNTFPLDRLGNPDPGSLLRRLVKRWQPKLLWHSGPKPADSLESHTKLVLHEETLPSSEDICMAINVEEFQIENHARRAARIRLCERRGFRWSAEESGIFSNEHIGLVEDLVSRVQPGGVSLALMARLGDFARQSQAYTINIFSEERLIGFCVVEGWFLSMDIALFSFGLRSQPGVKDYLQWATLQHAHNRGKRWVNSGYSINAGVKAFKEKWSAEPITSGYFDQLWHSYDGFESRHCHWPNRLLQRL